MSENIVLQRNLLALSLHNLLVVRKLSALPERQVDERLQFVQAKTGELVPALNMGSNLITLHSKFDPQREGQRFLELYEPNGVLLFLGLGAAFHIKPFLAKEDVSSIIILEESASLLRGILEKIDLHQLFIDPRVCLLLDISQKELKEYLISNYIPALLGDLKSIPLWPRFNANSSYFKEALKAVEATINEVADDYTVQAKFGKRWLANTLSNLAVAEGATTVLRPQAKVIITGAGPSLERSAKRIKQLKKEWFLIASDTSIPWLLQNDILPDCVLSIDCQQISYHHFLKGFPKHIPLVLDLASPPTLTRFSSKVIFFASNHPFSQFVNQYWRSFPQLDISGGNVGHAALSLACELGARQILLFGLDYACPEGKTYARGTYLYDYFNKIANRFSCLETLLLEIIFKNKIVAREKKANFITYITKPLFTYKTRLEEYIKAQGMIDRQQEGAIRLIVPKRNEAALADFGRIFCAGPPRCRVAEFLQFYQKGLLALPTPFNPVLNYLQELERTQRDLWTTLFPTLAALRREKGATKNDGASLLDQVRHYALNCLVKCL